MDVYLYLGDDNVADATLVKSGTNWIATETFSNVLVKAGESINIVVKAQVEAKEKTASNLIDAAKFTLTIRGEDENGNSPSGQADKASAKISLVEKWTAEVEAGKAKKTVLLRGAEDAIAEFTIKPSGASTLDLESVEFDASKLVGVTCEDLKLEWAVDEDFVTNGSKCVADGFVETISKDGATLRIVFDQEPGIEKYNSKELIEVEVSGLKINDKDVSDTFKKAYAEALVIFTQSGDGKSKTTYTVNDIKGYNASTKVSDLHFYDAKGNELKTDLTAGDQLEKGTEFTIQNSCSGEIQIMKMTYTVNRGNTYANKVVEISHADYPEYFKTTGGDKLTVYANSKDNCSVDNITIKVKGVSISGAVDALSIGDTHQLEAIVDPANAADTTVTWTTSSGAIATVSNTGLVTAVGAGSVTITVTTTDGWFTTGTVIAVS